MIKANRLKKTKKQKHLEEVNLLRNHAELALRLHIDNLVITYGFEAVEAFLQGTSKQLKETK